jgi:hypothetical protein
MGSKFPDKINHLSLWEEDEFERKLFASDKMVKIFNTRDEANKNDDEEDDSSTIFAGLDDIQYDETTILTSAIRPKEPLPSQTIVDDTEKTPDCNMTEAQMPDSANSKTDETSLSNTFEHDYDKDVSSYSSQPLPLSIQGVDVPGMSLHVQQYLEAAEQCNSSLLFELLKTKSIDINCRHSQSKMTALMFAAENGFSSIVKSLLEASADACLTLPNVYQDDALSLASAGTVSYICAREISSHCIFKRQS